MKPKRALTRSSANGFSADLRLIEGAFAAHLREVGYSEETMANYRWCLIHVARRLAKHGCHLRDLDRKRVAQFLRSKRGLYRGNRCGALYRWLKFLGRYTVRPCVAWWPWVDDYRHFLTTNRGLSAQSCRSHVMHAARFLKWRFRSGQARWSEVQVSDIRRYATRCVVGVKPGTANHALCSLRQLLRFAQLRGACGSQLTEAVPHVANFGRSPPPMVLSGEQRCRLLASIPRQSPEGKRDYAILLCLSELGLRATEAVHMRLGDLDWSQTRLTVPPVKNARRGRELPLPTQVASALSDYIDHARPPSASDRVFLRHRSFVGRPICSHTIWLLLRAAIRHCHLPEELTGAHKLRHTFASRLYERGATLKQIADLLGHQLVETAAIYTHTDLRGLRQLALPWPSQS